MQHQKILLLFNSLGPSNGKLSGEKARSYLLSSNLPTHSLKTIWDQSDRDKDGQLSYEEFTTAVQLVNQARSATNQAIGMSAKRGMSGNTSWNNNFQSFSQPQQPQQPVYSQSQSLSQSFNMAPFSQQPLTTFSPPKAAATLPTSNANSISAVLERRGSLPGSSVSDWAVDANSKKRYIALFNKFDSRRTGSLGGDIAKAEFTKSGLPLQTLGHIWGLADITKTGSLSADEFCVAMHLIENAQRGREPPESLSQSLTPPQYRNVIGRERSLTAGHFDTLNKGSWCNSLEEKKRANFNKGQAELEKRRLAKLEEERKAQEAAEQAAAAAAEVVRVQREAEERRRVEFQRQRTRSIEESVRRAEQENEEKQTIDKSKMESWAVQRKQQLESQLVRLTDLTTGLRVRRDLLQREHQDMRSRCERARSSLVQYREDTKAILLSTNKLREGRASVLHQVTVAKRAAMSSQSELSSITNDKVRLSQQLRTLRTVDEVMLTILSDEDKARDSILSLKTEYSHTAAQLDDYQTQMLNCNVAHQEMKSRLQSASEELREKETLLSQLQAMNKERVKQEEERKRRAEEERRRSEERESTKKRIEEAERVKERKRVEEEQAALVKERRRMESLNNDLTRSAERAASAAQSAALAQAALVSHQQRANLLIEERKKRKAEEMAKAYKKLEEMRANRPTRPPPSTDDLVSFSSPSHGGELELCEKTGEKVPCAQAGENPHTGERQLCEKTGEKLDKPLKRRKKKGAAGARPKSEGGKGKGKKNRPISISLPTTHPDFDPMEGPSAGASLKGLGEPIYAPIHSASPTPDTITEENPYSNTPVVPRKSFIKAPAREKMSYAAAGKECAQTGEKPQEPSAKECDDLIPDLMSHETPEKVQSKVTQELAGLFAVKEASHEPEDLYMNIDSCQEMLTDPFTAPHPSASTDPFAEPDSFFSTPVPDAFSPVPDEYLTPLEMEQQERREQPDDIYMNIDSYRLQPGYQEDEEDDDEFLSSSEDDEFDDEEHIYSVAQPKGYNLETLFEVVALYDFCGDLKRDELEFKEGARIRVLEVRGDDWYYGQLDEQCGMFPVNFVEKCEWIYSDNNVNSQKEVVALYPFHSEEAGDLSFGEGDIITVTEDMGDWLKGQFGAQIGIFPSTFVQERQMCEDLIPPPSALLPSADIKPHGMATVLEPYSSEELVLAVGEELSVLALDHNMAYIQTSEGKRGWVNFSMIQLKSAELETSVPKGAERIPASLHCISLYPYTAVKEDELSLQEDDIITITEQSDMHWWIGKLGNAVGVLPANFVRPINDPGTWDTAKAWAAEANTESDRTRQEAIHELILTEKSYIDDLLLVVEVFYNPLCAVASPVELSEVFVNWHQLILCNAKLFRALFDNRQNNLFTVGGVIVDEIDSLTLPYTKFCSCQRQAMQALAEATSAKFREIEKECGASPKVGKLPLSTFLLKPMQRITKYPLLIKKILQHSREDDPDYGQLKLALSKTEQLLVAVNEAVRTTSRLEVLQKSLVPDENSLGEKTVLNSCTNYMGERRLVHYGGLSKTRGAKELWGVLFNDSLWLKRVDRGRYGTTKPIDLDARDFDQIKFEHYREPFLLNDIILSEHTTDSIQFTHKDKPYIFHAVSEAQSKIWLDSLSQCVNEATSQYNRLYQTMVPDPLLKGQATLSLRVVEAGELALPLDDKQNSIYAQIALGGHIQRTPSSIPKWDHTMHFVVKDVNSAKVNITLHQSHKYSPNVSLGKFDLSLSKLLRSGSGPWNKRLILTDAASGVVNVSITLRHHGTASITAHR